MQRLTSLAEALPTETANLSQDIIAVAFELQAYFGTDSQFLRLFHQQTKTVVAYITAHYALPSTPKNIFHQDGYPADWLIDLPAINTATKEFNKATLGALAQATHFQRWEPTFLAQIDPASTPRKPLGFHCLKTLSPIPLAIVPTRRVSNASDASGEHPTPDAPKAARFGSFDNRPPPSSSTQLQTPLTAYLSLHPHNITSPRPNPRLSNRAQCLPPTLPQRPMTPDSQPASNSNSNK
ncbi:hypothetical protein ACJ73_10275 [Blastomyces percursus]|uniref:Uncharacterized protein n=1 Tax=Blastomyces percursus TaxID=1658174 RepID=A0A1J9PZQ8_9EURO|nr:hypothetical protein ACJ73_10275 [Blastomyces percursus]